MRDVLTREECDRLLNALYIPGQRSQAMATLQAAARLGAERAMQAPDGDLSAMLEQLPRLRDWYAIGPAQRAEVDSLVGWVRARGREGAAMVCDHLSTRAGTADDCAEAIRRGEEG